MSVKGAATGNEGLFNLTGLSHWDKLRIKGWSSANHKLRGMSFS